jgi:hypothetical protein
LFSLLECPIYDIIDIFNINYIGQDIHMDKEFLNEVLDHLHSQFRGTMEGFIGQQRQALSQTKSHGEVNHQFGFISGLEQCIGLHDSLCKNLKADPSALEAD